MSKARVAALVLGIIASVAADAACNLDVAAPDVDATVRTLQARQDSLAQLVRNSGGAGQPEAMWLEVLVREGVIEQIGQLQILKLLIGLREGVSGRENQRKVAEAEKAVMATVLDNANALQALVGQSRKTAKREAVAAELGQVEQALQNVAELIGDCHQIP